MRKYFSILACLGALSLNGFPIHGQTNLSYVDLFDGDEIIECQLEFDFKAGTDKSNNAVYESGRLTLFNESPEAITCPVSLRARGNSRKQYCQFPPLTVKIDLEGAISRGKMDENQFKLVTHCQPDGIYENYILEEYLVYRLYRVLTDWSFQVRLLHINYLDTGKRGREVLRYAFIIENLNLLTGRTGSQYWDQANVNPAMLDIYQECLLAMFQFMVGNTDWSLRTLHNIKVLKGSKGLNETLLPLPYDFDMSGMIDALHAAPSPVLNLESVRERLYRGYCMDESVLDEVIAAFIDKEDELKAVLSDFDLLKENQRKRNIKYINGFFELLSDKESFKKLVLDQCRKP